MNKVKGIVQGVGINDADYFVKRRGMKTCPYYACWISMLYRAYSPTFKIKYPTYKDVTVCPDWFYFMTFRSWMMAQDWQGKQLDKDILVQGNKEYGPKTCYFISSNINNLLTKRENDRGEWPLWVSYNKNESKFQTIVGNKGNSMYLGKVDCMWEAHKVGQLAKIQIILETIIGEDKVIQDSLLKVVEKIQGDYDNNLETTHY